MSNKLTFKIKEHEGSKIKDYLKSVELLSSRLIRGAAKEGRIKVNGERVNLRYILKSQDMIEVDINKEESQDIEPEDMNLKVIYEDDDIIAVDKPPGIVVHPTKSHLSGTLANGILYYFKEKGENCIVRLVSRLDMDTSGVIIIAKNQFSHAALSREMQENAFKKEYIALVHGIMDKSEGTIDLPIYRVGEGTIKRVIDERGQRSITHYEVLETFKNATLVKLLLETGRTHQIRVHLSHLGFPLFGDKIYGEENNDEEYINRQALHAYKVAFPHPKDKHIVNLESPLPEDIKKLIEKLKALG